MPDHATCHLGTATGVPAPAGCCSHSSPRWPKPNARTSAKPPPTVVRSSPATAQEPGGEEGGWRSSMPGGSRACCRSGRWSSWTPLHPHWGTIPEAWQPISRSGDAEERRLRAMALWNLDFLDLVPKFAKATASRLADVRACIAFETPVLVYVFDDGAGGWLPQVGWAPRDPTEPRMCRRARSTPRLTCRRSSWPWFTKATSTRSTSVPRWTSSWSPASPRIDGPQAGRDGYMSDRTGQAQARPPACATLRRSMVLCAMKRSMRTGTRLQTAFAKHGGPELRPAEALTAPVRQARPVRRVTGWMRKTDNHIGHRADP